MDQTVVQTPVTTVAPITEAPPAEAVVDRQNEADQAPAEKPVEKTETEEPPQKQFNKFQRRLAKVYQKLGEEKARAEQYAAELEKLRAPKALPEGAPKLEQFDDIEKYADAKAEWVKKQALKEHEDKQRSTAQQAQQKKLITAWEEKVSSVEAKYDDFEEVVGEIKPTHPLTVAIMREENGPDIAYFLGKNPKEAMRLATLEPIDQILAIGRLSAKLLSEPPVAKTPSKAPAPITPVSARSSTPADEPSEEDDMRTWIKKRNRQLGRK